MSSLESWLAAAGLVACVVLLVRLALPWRQRQRVDAWARSVVTRLRHRGDAEREAQAAIERARGRALREARGGPASKPPRRLH